MWAAVCSLGLGTCDIPFAVLWQVQIFLQNQLAADGTVLDALLGARVDLSVESPCGHWRVWSRAVVPPRSLLSLYNCLRLVHCKNCSGGGQDVVPKLAQDK